MFCVCLLCSTPSATLLCRPCQSETSALIHPRFGLERRVPGTDVPLFSFASYQGKIKNLVQLAKSQHLEKSSLVDEWLFIASSRLGESLTFARPQLVVPLPERRFGLDSRRLLARDLATHLGSQLTAPCHPDLLRHVNWVHHYFWAPQKEKNRAQRLTHPPQYRVDPGGLDPGAFDVILVDDVCTTGQSLRAAIKPLRDAGFRVAAAALLADTPSYL